MSADKMKDSPSDAGYEPSQKSFAIDLKKRTVRLPDASLMESATPVQKELLQRSIEQSLMVNDIVDGVHKTAGKVDSLEAKTDKGLRNLRDKLVTQNGRVTKSEEEMLKIKLRHQQEDERRNEQLAKEEKFRKRVISLLVWIVSIMGGALALIVGTYVTHRMHWSP